MKNSLLNSLFDDEEQRPLTVSELNEQVKTAIERGFSSVWVEAEIVNFVAARSGHWYFSLHDGESQLKAACYVRNNLRIRFQPFDGLQVRVRGKLSVYQPKGEYQILVESLQPVGEGALKIAFEQIKAKLESEGLFAEELKRPLPLLPKRVGVVTSPNGAAFHDILNVLARRTKTVDITLIPTLVQGEYAAEEIESAIYKANDFNRTSAEKIDVLIVGRGGGSAEDLWAFNEERVARAIRGSAIPVISAVGHEIDFTIADFAADRRAPTPSAAAEIVAESEEGLRYFIEQLKQDLFQIVNYRILHARSVLQESALSPVFSEYPQKIRDWRFEVEDLTENLSEAALEKLNTNRKTLENLIARLSPVKLAAKFNDKKTRLALLQQRQTAAIKNIILRREEKLKIRMASLDALSPLAVLSRGFSLTENADGKILRDVSETSLDEIVIIRLAEGSAEAKITKIND